MRRDAGQLTTRTFDVLVIGGGIYGLTIACDAASRGLTVALIERADFGSGSSFNHLRTIHGGLRYLQTLDLARARESIAERRTLARIAPHAVRPMPFVLPLFPSLTRGKLAMRTGFLLDRTLGRDRNDGVAGPLRLPAGRVVSRDEAIERVPGLAGSGLTGAGIWYDYLTAEPDRLTFTWAVAAANHGAVLANYVEAKSLLIDGQRVRGVRAHDGHDGNTIEIGAEVTVNATGSAVATVAGSAGLAWSVPLLKALNLVTRREAAEVAVGGRSPAGRNLFLVPWHGRALFGTWESGRECLPDERGVTEQELAGFIDEVNHAYPSLSLRPDDVALVHRGLVPANQSGNGRVTLQGHDQVRDHAADGIEGLLSVAGTKYTTARAVAERIVDRLFAKLGRPPSPCRTASVPLPGGDLGDVGTAMAAARRDAEAVIPSDSLTHLLAAYGSRYKELIALASTQPEWRRRLSEESPVVEVQLVWAVRQEMARTLADAVLRRTPLGALGYPGDAASERAADVVGAELGWTSSQRRAEIDQLRAFYKLIPEPKA